MPAIAFDAYTLTLSDLQRAEHNIKPIFQGLARTQPKSRTMTVACEGKFFLEW